MLPDSLILSELEFDLSCEFKGCDKTATVMCKGCADHRHFAICTEHLEYRRRWFYTRPHAFCINCHRPWVNFDTHYDVTEI